MENAPLWVWVIIVGAIIASSSIGGNQQNILLMKLNKKAEELILMMIKQKTSGIMLPIVVKIKIFYKYRSSQYSPKRYYKDYFNKEEGINV